MAELHPELAKAKAQTARQFLAGFNGEDFGILREDTPGPHDRRHLAIALDYVEELSAMVLNLADRVTPTYGPDNPPRLRKPGESIEEYRAAMGWSNKTPNAKGLAATVHLRSVVGLILNTKMVSSLPPLNVMTTTHSPVQGSANRRTDHYLF